MLNFFKYIFFIILVTPSIKAYSLETEWTFDHESQIRLISPVSNNNQKEFYLGLEYKLKDGWKTYWKSPGEAGFPQNINWSNSINVKNLNNTCNNKDTIFSKGLSNCVYNYNKIFLEHYKNIKSFLDIGCVDGILMKLMLIFLPKNVQIKNFFNFYKK